MRYIFEIVIAAILLLIIVCHMNSTLTDTLKKHCVRALRIAR